MSRASTSVLLECCAQRHGRAWPDHPACASRPSCPRLSRASTSLLLPGRKTWMPGTRPGMTARDSPQTQLIIQRPQFSTASWPGCVRSTASRKSLFTFQTANQTANQHPASSPVFFGEAPGRPVFPCLPSKNEGDGAPRGATIFLDVPAFPLGNTGRRSARHPDKLAQSGLICGVFLTAPGRAFRGRP